MPPSIQAPAVAMSAEQFTELMQMLSKRSESDPEMAKAVMELATQQSRTTRASNAFHPEVSAFSYPEGNVARPKPKLDRETWFCACKQDESMLTPVEIDLFNRITTSKVWRGDPKMGADVSPKRRFIMLPHVSIDERMQLPQSLPLILMELIGGQDAIKPETMAEELIALRAQVAGLAAVVAQQSAAA